MTLNYHPNGIKNLCNAIVISAVKDAIDPDVIYKEVYSE